VPNKRKPIVGIHLGALRELPLRDLLIRFGFGAAISSIAGIVSLAFGAEPGGLLLAFPAILPATLTLIERDDGESQAESLDVGSILGAVALSAFAVIVWQYMSSESASLVLSAATGCWFVVAVLLYLGFRIFAARRGPL
jgi:hypothetical protein